MATTRQPLKPITDPVSPVHRLRLTVAKLRFPPLWHYQLAEDGKPGEIKPLAKKPIAFLNESTAMEYATNDAIEEVGIAANFCDFTTDDHSATATIEVLAIEGVNILVENPDDPGRFYHADADDLPIAIAQELSATIRAMGWEPCDRYVAANGRGYRWGSKPRPRPPQPQTQGQAMTEQPTPPAPTAAELEAARRIGEALCLIPPQSLAEEVGKLIIAQKSLGDQFEKLKRDHMATLDTLGSHVRPMIGDLAKRFADIDKTFFNHVRRMDDLANRFADIDGTLIALRRDITFALDQLGFRAFVEQPEATAPPPAPIPDTPDGPPMT